MNLSGATALVTGANRGIGRALVERLAAEQVRVVLAGVRSVESFQAPAGEVSGSTTPMRRGPSNPASSSARSRSVKIGARAAS